MKVVVALTPTSASWSTTRWLHNCKGAQINRVKDLALIFLKVSSAH